MEGAADNFDYDRLLAFVKTLPGAKDIHDLPVWSVTPERVALSYHLIVNPENSLERSTEIIKQLKEYVLKEFKISHTTIEIETDQCGSFTIFKAFQAIRRAIKTEMMGSITYQ